MPADPYGLGRVIRQAGVLPQKAERLDPSMPLRSGEVLIDVESLNIDAASFKQLRGEVGDAAEALAQRIQAIVSARGKMQNPVTGSGGMLMGRVREIAQDSPHATSLKVGDRIATLVSLSLTPLEIRRVRGIHLASDRVDVEGHAILFASGICAKLPSDFPEELALALLDVCGAPAWVARLARPRMRILVLGAGKSGALCLAQARRSMQGKGVLLAADVSEPALNALHSMGLVDVPIVADATQALEVFERVHSATEGQGVDLVINCASVPSTEMAGILCVRDGGTLLLFSMATQFAAAALGAEGVGKDVTMIVGNGFVPGHAELTLELMRGEPALRAYFEKRYL